MATYFHGAPEIQSDGLQTLYLMNPNYVGYSDTAAPTNMLLLNSTMNSLNPINLSHAAAAAAAQPNQQQHFVGIPLQPTVASQESNRPQSIQASHDVSAVHGLVPRVHYNLWTPTAPNSSIDFASQFGPRRSSTVPQPQQGLSLSLSPREMVGPVPEITPASAEDVKILGSSSSVSGVSSGVSGLQSFLMGSKYLKAAQQLLDEVVNVGQGIKGDSTKGTNSRSPMKSSRESVEGTGAGTGEEDTSTKRAADLTTAERQELQMKKAKLVNMLDEVEQRYRQYHHQMQIVITSFEAVAGTGSARTYTALALQTISKQFRCLRDAITGQIRATSRSLGEEDTKSGGSRLRFVDHHLRQQRALQQLGMMQHNAWRPQRGLPERSVSILRAWLFEHFLHPYPKDSDKLMLAKQTGLSRSQVSNWFINARVRLWKPMVEEMYSEEMKDQEQNNTDDKASKSDANENSASKSSANQENSPTGTGQVDSLKTTQEHTNDPKTSSAAMPPSSLGNDRSHASYYDNEAAMLRRPKKARSDESVQPNTMPHSISFDMKSGETSNRELLMKFIGGRQRAGDQGFSLIAGSANNGGNFGAYPIADIGRFDSEQFTTRFSGNGVSLTLGLPHCENLSLSGAQPSFLADESMPSFNNNNPSVAHPSNAYESIDIQNRKRFAAQLLQTL